jgi:DNA-binding NarL/FixJ family response regulator
VRVLVAESHIGVRWALCTIASALSGLTVVGEAADAGILLGQVRLLHPDVVLLDWNLGGSPPEELVSALHAINGGVDVIALGTHVEAEKAALAAGARAFLLKTDPPDRLLAVLRQVQS